MNLGDSDHFIKIDRRLPGMKHWPSRQSKEIWHSVVLAMYAAWGVGDWGTPMDLRRTF